MFCFDNFILLEKLCKKVFYSMAKLFFNQKLFHFFCQNVTSSISFGNVYMVYCIPYMGNTVDFLPYMVETVGGGGGAERQNKMRWTPKQ